MTVEECPAHQESRPACTSLDSGQIATTFTASTAQRYTGSLSPKTLERPCNRIPWCQSCSVDGHNSIFTNYRRIGSKGGLVRSSSAHTIQALKDRVRPSPPGNTLFLYQRIFWYFAEDVHGVALAPSALYRPSDQTWIPNDEFTYLLDQTKEVFYRGPGHYIFYAGTFKCVSIGEYPATDFRNLPGQVGLCRLPIT